MSSVIIFEVTKNINIENIIGTVRAERCGNYGAYKETRSIIFVDLQGKRG
jgi:hypothetical protein